MAKQALIPNNFLLYQACEMDGFFYLVHHGVPDQLIQSTFSRSKEFFTTLTSDEKRSLLAVKSRGYTPLAEETLDPANQSRGDTKEGYYIGNREQENDDANDAAADQTYQVPTICIQQYLEYVSCSQTLFPRHDLFQE